MNKTLQIIIGIVIIVIIIVLVAAFYKPVPKEAIKIGAILPLTGAASYPGEQAKIGISIAAEEINSRGGIDGRKLEIIYEDSKTNPTEGVSAFQKLTSMDNVDMVISALSAVSMAIAPLAKEKEIPVIGIMTTARGFVQNEWTFRYQPLTDLEIAPIVQMVKDLNPEKKGVLYLNDEFGNDVFNSFKQEMSALGKEVYGEKYGVAETNFNDYVTKLKSKGIDSIYIVGFDSHLINIVQSLVALDFDGIIFSASTLSLPNAREKIKDVDKKIYIASPPVYLEKNLNENAKNLDKKLSEIHGIRLNHYNAISYDVIRLIGEALKDKKMSSNFEIKDSLESLNKYSGVFGELMITDNSHEIAYSFHPAMIEKGNILKFK